MDFLARARPTASSGPTRTSYGQECQCRHDGELAFGRLFILRELALGKAGRNAPNCSKNGPLCLPESGPG